MAVKRRTLVCFLVCVMVLGLASAQAAPALKIKSAEGAGVDGATVTKEDDSTVRVTYQGEKEQQYVMMAVAEEGIDESAGRPTVASITSATSGVDGVLVYMNQTTGDAQGQVEFEVKPNLDKVEKNKTYELYLSGSDRNSPVTLLGSFDVGGAILMGEVDGHSGYTPDDALLALKIAADPNRTDVEDWQKEAADVDGHVGITPDDALMILKKAADPANYHFPTE